MANTLKLDICPFDQKAVSKHRQRKYCWISQKSAGDTLSYSLKSKTDK